MNVSGILNPGTSTCNELSAIIYPAEAHRNGRDLQDFKI
jgi:hypothetical protein